MTEDKEMCKDFEDSGAVFPKVLPEHINLMMGNVRYETSIVPNTTTTTAAGILKVGDADFVLAIETTACIDKRNFNAEKRAKYAIEKCMDAARNKLWELEGYHLARELQKIKAQ